MSGTLTTATTASAPARAIPPLENGDRLTRPEFENRYERMPPGANAELVEGIVHMQAPVHVQHGQPHSAIIGWLFAYQASTPGIQLCDNTTLRLDADNEVQPDAMLRILPEYGGQSQTSTDGFVEGPPELVVEIAASSASYDLHDKLNAYRRNGVCEYLVWKTFDQEVLWHVLQDGTYHVRPAGVDGLMKSLAFPGLSLDAKALLTSNWSQLLQTLHQGISDPEHANFVLALESKRRDS